jgi:hypothetical protein
MEVSGQLHAPAALPPGKSPRYPLDRRLGGPQSRSGRFGEEKILDSNSDPSVFQPELVAITTTLSRLFIMSYSPLTIHPTFRSNISPPSSRYRRISQTGNQGEASEQTPALLLKLDNYFILTMQPYLTVLAEQPLHETNSTCLKKLF